MKAIVKISRRFINSEYQMKQDIEMLQKLFPGVQIKCNAIMMRLEFPDFNTCIIYTQADKIETLYSMRIMKIEILERLTAKEYKELDEIPLRD